MAHSDSKATNRGRLYYVSRQASEQPVHNEPQDQPEVRPRYEMEPVNAIEPQPSLPEIDVPPLDLSGGLSSASDGFDSTSERSSISRKSQKKQLSSNRCKGNHYKVSFRPGTERKSATIWEWAKDQVKYWIRMTYRNPFLWSVVIVVSAAVAMWAWRYGEPQERIEEASEKLFEERKQYRYVRYVW